MSYLKGPVLGTGDRVVNKILLEISVCGERNKNGNWLNTQVKTLFQMLISVKGTAKHGKVIDSVDSFGFSDQGKPLWEGDFWAKLWSRNQLYVTQKEGIADRKSSREILWGWSIVLNKQNKAAVAWGSEQREKRLEDEAGHGCGPEVIQSRVNLGGELEFYSIFRKGSWTLRWQVHNWCRRKESLKTRRRGEPSSLSSPCDFR